MRQSEVINLAKSSTKLVKTNTIPTEDNITHSEANMTPADQNMDNNISNDDYQMLSLNLEPYLEEYIANNFFKVHNLKPFQKMSKNNCICLTFVY